MTLLAYLTIFFLGSLFGAALMLIPVIQSETLRKQERDRWFVQWFKAWRKADKAESALDAIHAQHVAAGIKGGAATKAKLIDRQASERAQVRAVAQSIPFQPLRPRDEVVADIRQRREALKVAA